MTISTQEIQDKILAAIPDANVLVTNRNNDGVHFAAEVKSKSFAGKTKLQQHRMIYQALGDDMKEAIHALTLNTSAE